MVNMRITLIEVMKSGKGDSFIYHGYDEETGQTSQVWTPKKIDNLNKGDIVLPTFNRFGKPTFIKL